MFHFCSGGYSPRPTRAAAVIILLATVGCRDGTDHTHGALTPIALTPHGGAAGPDGGIIDYPDPDIGLAMLADRAATQEARASAMAPPLDFRLSDRQPESGITFRHQIVEEGGKHWEPVHYDHGSGVAAADVDGDAHPDLYFVSLVGGNQLWRNRGDGTFEDITARSGVAVAGAVSMAASFADYDGDGDADLFVTTIRRGNRLFRNDGRGGFEDVTVAAGLDYVGHSSTGTFLDWDRDGDLDLFLANLGRFTNDEERPGGAFKALSDAFDGHLYEDRTEPSILYRNDAGRFTDVSEVAGLVDNGWNGDAAFADLAGDGYPDLYVLNMQGDNHFYDNTAGHFTDQTAATFPKTPWGAMGVKFFDYDNDGDMDLMVTDMHSDMSHEVAPEAEARKSEMIWEDDYLQGRENNIFGNALWRNDGGGRFTEVSDDLGAENYWPWGVHVADFNADGWQDVFVSASMSYPFRYGANTLLINDGGRTFVDLAFPLGIEPRRDGRSKVPWFMLDCDDAADRNHLLCKGRSGRWTVNGNLGTRGAVVLDVDDDGDIDIVTNEFNAVPQVLTSDLAQRRPVHWLGVRLRGTRSNRDGLGAIVRVTAGGRALTQQVDGKAGYLSQSVLPVYFGLGDASAIDRIDVAWPSGVEQTITDGLSPNRTIEVVEAAGGGSS